MRKRVLTGFLIDRHVTVTDALERSLKRGECMQQVGYCSSPCLGVCKL